MTSRIKNYTRVEETFYKDDKHPYTIADYRRDFNDRSSIKFVYNYSNIDSESDEIFELVSNHAIMI